MVVFGFDQPSCDNCGDCTAIQEEFPTLLISFVFQGVEFVNEPRRHIELSLLLSLDSQY
jgi:hypothetical protein